MSNDDSRQRVQNTNQNQVIRKGKAEYPIPSAAEAIAVVFAAVFAVVAVAGMWEMREGVIGVGGDEKGRGGASFDFGGIFAFHFATTMVASTATAVLVPVEKVCMSGTSADVRLKPR